MPSEVAYGTYSRDVAQRVPLSTVDIRVSAVDIVVHWRRCALTADFLAGFLAPTSGEAAHTQLSMVIDELLENAVKFCADVTTPVEVSVRNFGEVVEVEASNVCDQQRARDLEQSVRRVLENDPERLFLEQIERTAVEDPEASRLGFITLCLHGGARLGARIVETNQDGLYNVSVQVLLPTQELGGS
jgi:hypothetical protein